MIEKSRLGNEFTKLNSLLYHSQMNTYNVYRKIQRFECMIPKSFLLEQLKQSECNLDNRNTFQVNRRHFALSPNLVQIAIHLHILGNLQYQFQSSCT